MLPGPLREVAIGLSRCRSLLHLGLAAWLGSCGSPGSSPAEPVISPPVLRLSLQTAHFDVYTDGATAAELIPIAARLEAEAPRMTGDFGVDVPVRTTVKIWKDPGEYFAAMTAFFGVRYDAMGYLARQEVRLLLVAGAEVNATHEFAHLASLQVNPTFGNRPRWLWETVALYENGEFVDPARIPSITTGPLPTLDQLNSDPNASQEIYRLGYLFGEFIVSRWGKTGLIRLIHANGDLPGVFGLGGDAFESAWLAWVRAKYLNPEGTDARS